MRTICNACVAALGVILAATAANAADEVRVDVYEYMGSPCFGSASPTTYWFDEGAAITINSTACVEQINITTLGSNHNIGHVTIDGLSRNPLEVIIGSGSFPTSDIPLFPAGVNWAGLTITNSGVRAATRLAGTITGDLTGSVHRFDVDGSVTAPFFVSGSTFNRVIIETGSITSSGAVIAWSGDITRVRAQNAVDGEVRADDGNIVLVHSLGTIGGDITASGGNISSVTAQGTINGDITATDGDIISVIIVNEAPLLGNVSAPNGAIGDIVIGSSLFQVGGDIGSSTDSVTIEAKNGIDLIDCGVIGADITTNFNGGAGDIVRCVAWGGDINGSLTARQLGRDRSIGEFLNIGGDINSDIVATDPLTTPIYVRGGLGANGSITLPAGGLQHQIFFNTLDEGTLPWDGTITVGSLVLDNPEYDYLPGILGGGGAGLIHYGIHDKACEPDNGALIGGNGSGSLSVPPDEIVLEHYGPIDIAGPTPVTVERRSYPVLIGGGQWTDVTSQYLVEKIVEAPGATNDVEWGRRLRITPLDGDPYDTGYEYRIKPTANLTTDALDNVPNPPIADYTYQIRVLDSFDLNLNGSVDAPDVTVWAADPIDLNDDQSADSQDLADLLEEVGQSN